MKEAFFTSWSQVHGGVKVSGIVRIWLTISYYLVRPLQMIKVSPNALTFFGLASAVGFLLTLTRYWALLFLVLSLIFDGIDGSLAILRGKTSRFGALLDATVDRIVEGCWALGFYWLGAPIEIILIAWLAAFIQEYIRARAQGLGIKTSGVITIAERPIRASALCIALSAVLFNVASAPEIVDAVAVIWLFAQLISVAMVIRNTKNFF